MIYEYMLYVFLGIGFVIGLIRGLYKEIINLVSMIVAFVVTLFTFTKIYNYLNILYPIENIYSKVTFLKYIGIGSNNFKFILIAIPLFLLIFGIISIIFNGIFFNNKKMMRGNVKTGNKFLGGVLGIASGLVLGLLLMFAFVSGSFTIDNHGPLMDFFNYNVFYKIPNLKDILDLLEIIL